MIMSEKCQKFIVIRIKSDKMKSKESSVYYLDSLTAGKYMSAMREREGKKTPITEFMVADIEKALKLDQIDLLKLRESNILDLKHYANEAVAKRDDFVKNLSNVTGQLQATKEKSNELYISTNQISVDFSKVTDQLDFATSLVNRAEDMSIIIKYIQDFNLPLEEPPMKKDPNQPPPDPNDPNPPEPKMIPAFDPLDKLLSSIQFPPTLYQRAEICAKLIKIVASAEGNQLNNAKNNLQSYRERLRKELVQEFKDNHKVNKYEQAKCAAALDLLQHEYDAMEAFINQTVLMTEAGNKYHFKDKYLFQSESQLLEHYKDTCNFFVSDCKKNWEVMEVIFNKSQQPKTALVTSVFNAVFDPFITRVLRHYLDPRNGSFCEMFYKLVRETNEMLKEIWALDGQMFNNANITENTFHQFQVTYENREYDDLKLILDEHVNPVIRKLEALIENAKKLFLKKDDANFDIFTEFNPQMPITILTFGGSAWERCVVLCDSTRKHTFLQKLIDLIISDSLSKYLTTYLEACSIYMTQKNDISVVEKFIAVTSVINMTILTIEDKYTQILKQHLIQKPRAHEKFINQKDTLIAKLEEGITKNLQICINIITERVKSIVVSKPFKTGFLRSYVKFGSVSKCCQDIISILSGPNSVFSASKELTGENNISFCSVLSKDLVDIIINALFDVRYDFPEGTMQLSIDVNEYKNCFSRFNLDFVNNKFEDLDKAVKLMNAPADNIAQIKKDLQMQPKSIDLARRLLPLREDAKEQDLASAL